MSGSGWVHQVADRHTCAPPAAKRRRELWRCDCGRLHRSGPACGGCHREGHGHGGFHVEGLSWRFAPLWAQVLFIGAGWKPNTAAAGRLTLGPLQVYSDRRNWWVGVHRADDAVYLVPLPMLVFRVARRQARERWCECVDRGDEPTTNLTRIQGASTWCPRCKLRVA